MSSGRIHILFTYTIPNPAAYAQRPKSETANGDNNDDNNDDGQKCKFGRNDNRKNEEGDQAKDSGYDECRDDDEENDDNEVPLVYHIVPFP